MNAGKLFASPAWLSRGLKPGFFRLVRYFLLALFGDAAFCNKKCEVRNVMMLLVWRMHIELS